jgi:hypothetical protein
LLLVLALRLLTGAGGSNIADGVVWLLASGCSLLVLGVC